MRGFLRLGPTALMLLALCGCKVAELAPIEGKIFFEVTEGHVQGESAGKPLIGFCMETEKIYPCCNYSIRAALEQLGENITIRLSGIDVPGVCLTALGPASAVKALELAEGSYELVFKKAMFVNRYRLTVRPDAIEVGALAGTAPFTEPKTTLFWRFPPNSFAYLCGTTSETAWICNDFLSLLTREIELEEVTFPAYGKVCYPASSQGHQYDMPAKYFVYKDEADFERAGELLRAYAQSLLRGVQGVGLSLVNWKNKRYDSWLMLSP